MTECLPVRAGHRSAWLCWRNTLALTLIGLSAGCFGTAKLRHEAAKISSADDRQRGVKISGSAMLLGQPEKNTLTQAEFLQRARGMLGDGRTAAVRRFIEHYPDIALKVLRESPASQGADPSLQVIAHVYDQQCVRGASEATWEALWHDRHKHPERYATYDKARSQVADHLHKSKFTEAASVSLATQLPRHAPPLLEIDARHLEGTALLMDNRPQEAVKTLRTAVELAQYYPHQAAHLLLLLSESQRRAGDEQQAIHSWKTAVELAGSLLTTSSPVRDASLWERCAYLRPVEKGWPVLAQDHVCRFVEPSERLQNLDPGVALASYSDTPDAVDGGESLIWTCIGRCRFERNELQAALLAFKQAEAWATDGHLRDQLRLNQAQVFAQLQQKAAALALLVQLSNRAQLPIACPALAMMGALKLQDGSVQQGLALLRRAVEENETVDWPDRGEAMANLALAYLMAGDAANGLRWLHAAQQRFEFEGSWGLLRQSLENEAAFLKQTGNRKMARPIYQRIRELEEMPSAGQL